MRGRVAQEDRQGNEGADALAVAGAKRHAIPAEVVRAACERRHLARTVQRMMLEILRARLEAEAHQQSALAHTDADRGSEMGDCIEDVTCLHDSTVFALHDDVVTATEATCPVTEGLHVHACIGIHTR